MSAPATDYVIHFPESYLDYDKPWGNRKAELLIGIRDVVFIKLN